jgi:hypothetical protein
MKSPTKTNKILIVIQFWQGDRDLALQLARLLADIQLEHCALADILFVSRFDTTHDAATVQYVSRKFNVFTHTSQRRGTGWPMGCNSLFFGSLEWAYHKMAAAQALHYKAILILGADGVPLRPDWISQFSSAWDEFEGKKVIAGALIPDAHHPHINGDCALLSGDLKFLHWLVHGVCDIKVQAGWDWVLSYEFQTRGWANLPFVKSAWNKKDPFTEEEWDAELLAGTTWFHGQKGFSLLNLARKKLL